MQTPGTTRTLVSPLVPFSMLVIKHINNHAKEEKSQPSLLSHLFVFSPHLATSHPGHKHILWLLCLRIFQIDAFCPIATILEHLSCIAHFWIFPFILPFRHSYNAYLVTTHFYIQCLSGFPFYHTQQNQEFVS